MIHAEINVTVRLLFTIGAVLFLAGVLAMAMTPVVEGKPALQPSPRPTVSLPPLTPTPDDPPTAEPPAPPTEPDPPPPEAPTATPTVTVTPTPVLLPNAGGAVFGCGLAGIGAGALLFGLFLVALRRGI